MTDIGTLGGTFAEANDINDAGIVVGSSTTATGQWHAFVYDGTMRDITPLAGFATALGINNRGEVVGTADGNAFLYSDGRFVDLNTQIDGTPGWTLAAAHDINDTGQIVGVGTRNAQDRIFRLDQTLLARFAPELRYDLLDTFRADSAATMTDNVGSGYSNTLKDGTGTVFADANNAASVDDLSLGYLGLVYPAGGIANGRTASESDNIEAANSYESDAQRMHSDSDYANRVYGRTFVEPDGRKILQY